MRKIVLGLLLITTVHSYSNQYNFNISNMDILGIRLGDNLNNVKNKLPCQKITLDTLFNGKIITGKTVRCGNTNYGAEFFAVTNHNNNFYYIARAKVFSIKPNFFKIKKRLIKKYGKPTKSFSHVWENCSSPHYSLCYGDCTFSNANKSVSSGVNAPSLTIEYGELNKRDYAIKFLLVDPSMEKINDEWAKNKINDIQQKTKMKEENFKF